MRFVMFQRDGKKGLAASGGGAFRGYCEDEAGYPGDLDALVGSGRDLRRTGAALLGGVDIDLAACEFLPPLARPSKILCVGLNYADHSKEIGFDLPAYPTIFCRFPSSLTGHGQPLVKPKQSDKLDYEGELAAVIGKRARAVPEDRALEYVAGYSLFNDATLRDYQFMTTQWTVGKNFDGTGPFGPWLVTPDELPPGGAGLAVTTRLNGAVMQRSNTDAMIFGVARLIALLSETMTLEPGDVLVTGTPAGVGTSRKPPVFMKEGDMVEVEIERMGVLRNPVVALK